MRSRMCTLATQEMQLRTSNLNSWVRGSRSLCALGAFASAMMASASARAQTITASLPGSAASPTAAIPNSACAPTTTRTYAAWQFNVATAGMYTFNVTKGAGSPAGLTLTFYQGIFLPTNTCVNQWVPTVTSGTTSASTSTLLSPAGTFILVIGGANASDMSSLTVTATGPAALTSICTESSLTPASQSVTNVGGMFSTTYSPSVGCGSWTTSGVPAWITGVPASGSGRATINYTVAANTGAARSASITIGGQTLGVNQSASCMTTLNPTSTSVAAAGGSGNFMLTGTAGCAYTTSTTTPWIRNVAPAMGTGSGTITFSVDPNTGPARTGTITAGGRTFTVNQASGCTYTVNPALVTPTAAGGAQMVRVETAAGCTWTTATATPWITGLPANGSGAANVPFNVAANTGPLRSGSLTVGGQTVSVVQADGCSARLDPGSRSVPAAAGMASVMVNVGAGCAWSMSSTAGWLVPAAMNGTGPLSVNYTYAANTGGARAASLVVGGSLHNVDQAAAGAMDSGVIVDSGVIIDSGVIVDTGVIVDSGVLVDSGVATDSAAAEDSSAMDVASSSDGSAAPDANDAATQADAASSSDVATRTDANAASDGSANTNDAAADGGTSNGGGACGCRTPTQPTSWKGGMALTIAALAAALRRRRARSSR